MGGQDTSNYARTAGQDLTESQDSLATSFIQAKNTKQVGRNFHGGGQGEGREGIGGQACRAETKTVVA